MSSGDKRRPARCAECRARRPCPLPVHCPPARGGAWEFKTEAPEPVLAESTKKDQEEVDLVFSELDKVFK